MTAANADARMVSMEMIYVVHIVLRLFWESSSNGGLIKRKKNLFSSISQNILVRVLLHLSGIFLLDGFDNIYWSWEKADHYFRPISGGETATMHDKQKQKWFYYRNT